MFLSLLFDPQIIEKYCIISIYLKIFIFLLLISSLNLLKLDDILYLILNLLLSWGLFYDLMCHLYWQLLHMHLNIYIYIYIYIYIISYYCYINSNKFSWWELLLLCSISFLFFYLLILSIIGRGVLKSSIMNVGISVFVFNSFRFLFHFLLCC